MKYSILFSLKCFYIAIISISVIACKTYRPTNVYSKNDIGHAPDYSNLTYWAAHPAKEDAADKTPDHLPKSKEPHQVDVFFIYPTIYYGDKDEDKWNADVDSKKLNEKIDSSTILFQASAFNQAGNVYSPRYRQAHLNAYFTKDTVSAKKAFALAYADVKSAFEYYLSHFNMNRPFIIASHSQGTNHAEHLIKEYIDGTNLKNRLVAAYLIGMPIGKNTFKEIPPCEDEYQTGCFTSWRTFKKGVDHPDNNIDIAVTNPISWTTSKNYIPKEMNPGSILRKFDKVYPKLVDAQISNGILWATKPKFPGSFFFRKKNYHIADINFYYFSIRQNAINRISAFWKR
jgi:Protein of unknown function (DUF3089)